MDCSSPALHPYVNCESINTLQMYIDLYVEDHNLEMSLLYLKILCIKAWSPTDSNHILVCRNEMINRIIKLLCLATFCINIIVYPKRKNPAVSIFSVFGYPQTTAAVVKPGRGNGYCINLNYSFHRNIL